MTNNVISLFIDSQQTILAEPDHSLSLILPVGYDITSDKYFKQTPPDEAQIEAAIIEVEDMIMPLVAQVKAKNYRLETSDPKIREIAGYVNIKENVLSLSEMESVFSRFAAIVMGMPSSMDVLPQTKEFAATLLILREIMHHLGFENIFIV